MFLEQSNSEMPKLPFSFLSSLQFSSLPASLQTIQFLYPNYLRLSSICCIASEKTSFFVLLNTWFQSCRPIRLPDPCSPVYSACYHPCPPVSHYHTFAVISEISKPSTAPRQHILLRLFLFRDRQCLFADTRRDQWCEPFVLFTESPPDTIVGKIHVL